VTPLPAARLPGGRGDLVVARSTKEFTNAQDARDPDFEEGGAAGLVERELPRPGRGEARVKVQACGVCHSDVIAKEARVDRNFRWT
jgi:hypothetical protein